MKYLITNIWYWRARLIIEDFKIIGDEIEARVVNLGHASTSNASFHYTDSNGDLLWHSETFGVNATNESIVIFDSTNLSLVDDGFWSIHYQKRVIDSSKWTSEQFSDDLVMVDKENIGGFLPSPSWIMSIITIVGVALIKNEKDDLGR